MRPNDMTIHWCENLDELIDFIAYVVGYGPDKFPKRDYLKPDERLNLERAFEELRYGLGCAAKEVGELPAITTARDMLGEAYTHYREGRINPGAWKLQEISQVLKKIRR
jgi:hypothetical protein